MTDDELRPDPEVARLLRDIPVPEYGPGFWDRLESRLAEEARPLAPAARATTAHDPRGEDDDVTVVPLAARRRPAGAGRGRGLAVLAAAAAIVVAVVAVRLAADDGGSVTATQPISTTTSVPISTLAGNRVGGTLHQPGSAESPQDAFVSWVTAARDGDVAAARRLVGPTTLAYLAANGGSIDDTAQAYVPWAEAAGRTIEVIDFGEVEGRHVAGLVLSRPAADGVETVYDSMPVVETPGGWLVEPSAFDPEVDSRIEVVAPEAGEGGLTSIAPGAPVQVQLSGTGVYYIGCDTGRLAGFVPGDAKDGVLSWTPDPELAEGTHLLVVAHISPKVLSILVAPFGVDATPPG